ncbi:MAG: type II secretion system F family protein [Pyramidobacter sp.]|jgi:type II secretory pathway component PulF
MVFKYRIRDFQGNLRDGTETSGSAEELAEALKSQGALVLALEPVDEEETSRRKVPWTLPRRLRLARIIPLSRKALFFRRLAALSGAGIVLERALRQTLKTCENRALAQKAAEIAARIDGGVPFSQAADEVNLVGVFEKTVLAVGEETGRLAQSLELIAKMYERKERLRSKTLSALTYPLVLLIFSLGVFIVLFTFILPRFQNVFLHMGLLLPPFVRKVFDIGAAFPKILLGFAAAIAAFGALLFCLRRFPETRRPLGKAALKVPLYGTLLLHGSLAKSARLLSTLLESGVPLLRSLDLASQASQSMAVREGFEDLLAAAARGESLGERASHISFFAPVIAPLLSAGEQSGKLPFMVERAAEWYENRLEEEVKRLCSLLEPAMIFLVGGVAAMAVFAVFTPMVEAIRSLSL